jgi:hypothetical protein
MDEAALREKVGQLLSEVHSLPGVSVKAAAGPERPPAAGGSAMRREMAALEDSLGDA